MTPMMPGKTSSTPASFQVGTYPAGEIIAANDFLTHLLGRDLRHFRRGLSHQILISLGHLTSPLAVTEVCLFFQPIPLFFFNV